MGVAPRRTHLYTICEAPPAQPPGAPCVLTYKAYTECDEAMNRRLRCAPPKHRLAQRSGRWIWPIRLPCGEITMTPSLPSPMPQPHHRLPSTSQDRKSVV